MADPTTPDTRLTLTRIIEVALHEELSKYSNLSAMALRSRDVSRRLADAVVAAPELLQLADESSRLREALAELEGDFTASCAVAGEKSEQYANEKEYHFASRCQAEAYGYSYAALRVKRMRDKLAALAPPKERT